MNFKVSGNGLTLIDLLHENKVRSSMTWSKVDIKKLFHNDIGLRTYESNTLRLRCSKTHFPGVDLSLNFRQVFSGFWNVAQNPGGKSRTELLTADFDCKHPTPTAQKQMSLLKSRYAMVTWMCTPPLMLSTCWLYLTCRWSRKVKSTDQNPVPKKLSPLSFPVP